MEVRAVLWKRVLSKWFAAKRIFDGEVQSKGTLDVPSSRVVAVSSVSRGRLERYITGVY